MANIKREVKAGLEIGGVMFMLGMTMEEVTKLVKIKIGKDADKDMDAVFDELKKDTRFDGVVCLRDGDVHEFAFDTSGRLCGIQTENSYVTGAMFITEDGKPVVADAGEGNGGRAILKRFSMLCGKSVELFFCRAGEEFHTSGEGKRHFEHEKPVLECEKCNFICSGCEQHKVGDSKQLHAYDLGGKFEFCLCDFGSSDAGGFYCDTFELVARTPEETEEELIGVCTTYLKEEVRNTRH